MEVTDFCISQGLLWNTQEFFLIFFFRAFSILHFATYVDNACVAKTTKFSELRKLLPTNDTQGNPTRGTAQARSRGPSPFRGRAHPRSRGGPRAAKMGTKICYQGSWVSPIASHEWVLKFVIKVVDDDDVLGLLTPKSYGPSTPQTGSPNTSCDVSGEPAIASYG